MRRHPDPLLAISIGRDERMQEIGAGGTARIIAGHVRNNSSDSGISS